MTKDNNYKSNGKALKSWLLFASISLLINSNENHFMGEQESNSKLTDNLLYCKKHKLSFNEWYRCKDFKAYQGKQKCYANCIFTHKDMTVNNNEEKKGETDENS